MQNNTTIKTKTETALAQAIGFHGKYVSSLIRSAQNYGLSGAKAEELLKSYQQRLRRQQKKTAAEFGLSVAAYNRLQEKAKLILKSFHTGHSMGCYRSLQIKVGKEFKTLKTFNSLKNYSKSCKWRPTYGSLELSLTVKELNSMQNIEGVWTILDSDGSAKWLVEKGSKNSYEIKWQDGFVFETSHSTVSLEDAIALESRKKETIAKEDQENARFIGLTQIRRVACQAGIEAFCRRHHLDIEMGYNLGYLKSFNDSIAMSYLQKI